jgi:hypothetical protein
MQTIKFIFSTLFVRVADKRGASEAQRIEQGSESGNGQSRAGLAARQIGIKGADPRIRRFWPHETRAQGSRGQTPSNLM